MIRRLLSLAVVPSLLAAQGSAPTVKVGGFVDAYVGWDTGRPADQNRAFTTQAARHAEFGINLAHVELTLAGERVRGRLALQAGTSVQANYAGETRQGALGGPDLARHLQEAVAGVRVAPGLWLDGGVFFSHIGQESWISRDNPTYTRSFTAEYTPYYGSGLKATWSPSATVTAQLHLVNGWQNITETNEDKALGGRIDWTPVPGVTVGWAAFRGNERTDSLPSRTRMLHQLFAKVAPVSGLTLWGTVDRGTERGGGDPAAWWSATLVGEVRVGARTSIAGRVERYVDRDGVLIPLPDPQGFDVTSGSLGLNLRLPEGLLWRSEVRLFRSGGAIWPDGAGLARRTALAVTSLALTL